MAGPLPVDAVFRDDDALARALERAVERRWGLGRSQAGPRPTTAFRLVNEEGDGLPRLAVDVYGSWLVAQLYPGAAGRRGPLGERGDHERRCSTACTRWASTACT